MTLRTNTPFPPLICDHNRPEGAQDCEQCETRLVFDFFDLLYGRVPSDRGGTKRLFTPFPRVYRHGGYVGAIGRYSTPGSRRFAKKHANRLMRRLAKHDPANAPTRLPIRGYVD